MSGKVESGEEAKEISEYAQDAVLGSLVDTLDCRVMVHMLDGKVFLGILRSFDQYMNMVLEKCKERVYVEKKYADADMGVMVIKWESVKMITHLPEDFEIRQNKTLAKGSFPELKKVQREQRQSLPVLD